MIVVKEGFEYAGGKGYTHDESVLVSLPGNMSPQRDLFFCFFVLVLCVWRSLQVVKTFIATLL